MIKRSFALSVAAFSLLISTGCANGYGGYGAPKQIIIDTRGVDMDDYYGDLADCEDYARQIDVKSETTQGVVEGAVVGAVIGAVAGNHNTAQRGAGAGAIVGGLKGNKQARLEQERIVRRCLSGRGYNVLN